MPVIIVPSAAPENFTIIGISSTSVKLRWDPPVRHMRKGEIIQYEIIYYKQLDQLTSFDVNATATEIVLDGFEPLTNYIFKIKAYTSKGAGPWSNQIPYQTMGRSEWLFVFMLA